MRFQTALGNVTGMKWEGRKGSTEGLSILENKAAHMSNRNVTLINSSHQALPYHGVDFAG